MKRFGNSKKIVLLLSLVMIMVVAVHSTIAFVQAHTQPLTNTFKPNEYVHNDLVITKEVEHPYGINYVIPEDIAFDFEINLGTAYANAELTTSEGEMTVDENGILKVKIKPGAEFYVKSLIEGTQVSVKELECPAGFAVSGTDVQTVEITDTGAAELAFVNVYEPTEVKLDSIQLIINKNLVGREGKSGDEFAFLLEYDGGNDEWQVLAEKKTAYDAESKKFADVDFSDVLGALELSEPGTYSFRISEKTGNTENIKYDKTVHTFRVTVSDKDMDGALEFASDVIASEKMTSEKNSETGKTVLKAEFTNIYSEAKDVTVEFKVNKTVKNIGTDSIGPENFTFVLEDKETGEKLTAKTDENGSAVLSHTYTCADAGKTFTYQLKEINDGRSGVTYSNKVYDIKVKVTLDASGNAAAAVYSGDTLVNDFAADFENIYEKTVVVPEDSTVVRIPVVKTIKSYDTDPIGSDSFEFVLENTETGEKLTAKTDTEGNAVFDLVFYKADAGSTFSYKLTEINDGKAGVTYSDAVYNIEISVKLDQSGKPVAEIYSGGEKAPENFTAAFENIYKRPVQPDDITVKLPVQKTVINTGKTEIGPEGFEFVLEDTDSGTKVTQRSDEEGAAEFTLTYSAEDIGRTYNYRITETNDAREGVVYSETVYEVQTVISLGADGKLKADIIYNSAAVTDFTAEFENEYKAVFDDLTVKLTAQKVIKNETKEKVGPENFIFILEDTDTHKKLTETSDKNGLAEFELVFTEDHIGKTFNYKLYEKNDERPGFVYSTKVYEVHITVKVGEDGKLAAVITTGNAEVPEFKAQFENIYKGVPIENLVIPVDVFKTVSSDSEKTIGPENFRFKLTDENGFNKFAVTNKEGIAEFKLSFTAEDAGKSFTYRLTEVNDGVKGVTYSDAVYNIRIDVKLNEEENILVAEMFINDVKADSLQAQFENKYTPPEEKPPSKVEGDNDSVDTGDDTNLTPWIIMFVLSAVLLIILLITGKKSKKDDDGDAEEAQSETESQE